MPPEDVSHREIYVRLAELGAKIDSILAIMAERNQHVARITKDLDALFSRQRALESRLAQIAGIGLVLAVGIPALATMFQIRLAVPVEHQQVKP
jgi:uncharacterized membrane protein